MKRPLPLIALAVVMLVLAGTAHAQFNTTGTTTLSLTVAAEASLRIDTTTTTLATSGSLFNNDYTGTTNYTYKIRTTKSGGSGAITLKVTSDFSPSPGGPSVGAPASTGDALTYTCSITSPGTACTGSLTASTTAGTSVSTFGADAKSALGGNTGSVGWNLTNDPQYSTGTYTAVVTFTISAT